MNNEETILAMLGQMQTDTSSVKPQLTSQCRLDALEHDVALLKTAVKMLTQEVAELKKAQ